MIHLLPLLNGFRMNATRRRVVAECALVVCVALVPRLFGIGTFLTADEKNWMGRGWEFVRAVREFRFNDTLQTTHPGIPTLWVAGVTAAVVSAARDIPFSFDHIRTFVTAAQVPFAVLNSLLVGGIFLVLRALLGARLALLAGLVIALDPFLVAHSKVVHVDALLAGTTALALVLLLLATRERASAAREGTALVAAGITSSVAILSKLPGLILVPMAALAIFTQPRGYAGHMFTDRLRRLARWFLVVLATTLVLWPGLLWVPDPVGNIKIVKRDLVVAVSTPHNMLDDYSVSLGHYPATLLTRTTVPTLVGFLLFLFLLARATRDRVRGKARGVTHDPFLDLRPLWLLTAFIALFMVAMTFGAKKGDRYLLPVFPILDILSVVGMAGAVAWLRPPWPERLRGALVAALMVIPLGLELARLGPYALAHYNPLFPHIFWLELGWGEGLDQVAAYFQGLPDGGKIGVASWYSEELRALMPGRPVYPLTAHEQIPIGYVVLYRNMLGRPPSHPANDFLEEYLERQTPVHTVRINGLPYAWVFQRPVYSAIVGELLPGKTVSADLAFTGSLTGIDAYVATYSRTASAGALVVRVRAERDGPDLRSARVPVNPEADNTWVHFAFEPLVRAEGARPLIILVSAEGARAGNAPTVRYAPLDRDRHFSVEAEGRGTKIRPGLLGIRPSTRAPQ